MWQFAVLHFRRYSILFVCLFVFLLIFCFTWQSRANKILLFCIEFNPGFISYGSSQEYEALQFAINLTNAMSNISIRLQIFNASTERGIFDTGEVDIIVSE